MKSMRRQRFSSDARIGRRAVNAHQSSLPGPKATKNLSASSPARGAEISESDARWGRVPGSLPAASSRFATLGRNHCRSATDRSGESGPPSAHAAQKSSEAKATILDLKRTTSQTTEGGA